MQDWINREFVERFLREARAAARLSHPHIVTIHDVGEAEGTYFIVMEYLEGPSLANLLRRQGALPPQQVAQIISHSPDGAMLALGSEDGTVRLWRVSDGTLLRTLERYTEPVYSVAFSPDGALLASGARDGTVWLWGVGQP